MHKDYLRLLLNGVVALVLISVNASAMQFHSFAFSPDERSLALCGHGNIAIWSVQSHRVVKSWNVAKAIHFVRFDNDGKQLIAVATSDDHLTISWWQTSSGKLLKSKTLNRGGYEYFAIALSNDEKYLAFPDSGGFAVWNLISSKLEFSLVDTSNDPSSIDFSPDGNLIATGTAAYLEAGAVRLWNAKTGKLVRTLQSARDEVNDVIFSPDGQTLASSGLEIKSEKGTVRLWDVPTGLLKHSMFDDLENYSVVFSSSGDIVASGSGPEEDEAPGEIKFWNTATGQLKQSQQRKWAVTDIVFSPDNTYFVVIDAKPKMQLWDTELSRISWVHLLPEN